VPLGGVLTDPLLHVALFHPEIPPNTGNVGRLCVGYDLVLHLVHPLGFDIDEKAVRRAGLDYWKHVRLVEHRDAGAFWAWAEGRRVHAFTTRAERPFTAARWAPGDVLLFGPESVGLPASVVDAVVEAGGDAWRIPMWGPIRSLNLANAVSVATIHALTQLVPAAFADPMEAGCVR